MRQPFASLCLCGPAGALAHSVSANNDIETSGNFRLGIDDRYSKKLTPDAIQPPSVSSAPCYRLQYQFCVLMMLIRNILQ